MKPTPKQQTATLRHLRMAPRKVRAVASLLRGLSVNEAEAQLIMQRRRPAGVLLKLLRSGVANAKQQGTKFDVEKLFIASIRVDGGVMLRRSLPRARGSADPIQKKSSHVTIILQERDGKPNRFLMQSRTKKKNPKADSDRGTRKRLPKPEDTQKEAAQKDPGFFKKVFTRKAI